MQTTFDLKNHLIELFQKNEDILVKDDSPEIYKLRKKALDVFSEKGFPTQKLEQWKNTDLTNSTNQEYEILFNAPPYNPVESYFKCNVLNFDTYMFTLLNGWYVHKNAPLTLFPDGTIVGSLAHARVKYKDIVDKYLGKIAVDENNPMISLNNAFIQDGVFIYVPEKVVVNKPMQIVNIVKTNKDLFIQNRNLIIVEKNAELKLVHCDDSLEFGKSFINNVTEIVAKENSFVEYYKLENKDEESTLINNVYIHQKDNSNISTNTITLNSGITRNTVIVDMDGEYCEANVNGLYLVDGKQKVDNYVKVEHKKPNSLSRQLFKGIMDDHASGSFNGYVVVHKDAQKTQAYQTNRNIALTDDAFVSSKPFLEIYADDVKCSHGATIGQLDDDAMFYLRSRGICERNARMLLMYAFAMEVVNNITIESLHQQIDDMVTKRLKGELSICDQCVLHCSDPVELHFEIDLSKI